MECIINGFAQQEKINFWLVWHSLTNDEGLKKSIPAWLEKEIHDFSDYVDDEAVITCLLSDIRYKKHGFHFLYDEDDPEIVFIMENGKDNKQLNKHKQGGSYKVVKVIEGCQ